MPPKSRTYQPPKVRAALAAQTEALRAAVHGLTEEQLELPTRLGTWRVRELVAHLGMALGALPQQLDVPVPAGAPLGAAEAIGLTRTVADAVDEGARALAAAAYAGGPEAVAEEFDRSALAVLKALDGPDVADPDRRIATRLGRPIPMTDYLLTRLLEAVVHADDLADALGPDAPAFPHDRQALAAVTRLLADAFAERAPGGAVELRIPPYAVVQAVEGPKHTRGTPPNVVETDPLTWIRLATGRLDWAAAQESAALTASGERSDLREHLPVMG
ncbi:sterol carrier family protein [Streptomyces sp. Y1]|uniref:Sterol carrier family protein n=1 Tax=Streptomyces sp. Y1 TaxID=3238634 RepID=A0AB39TLA3_9ACTN